MQWALAGNWEHAQRQSSRSFIDKPTINLFTSRPIVINVWNSLPVLSVFQVSLPSNDLFSSLVLAFFGRPYYRSSLWYSVSAVVCLSVCLSVVCNVLYCGKTVHPSEKVSEGVNRKPGSKSSFFFGRRHISTSGFAATATKTAVFALFLLV